ncbi:Methyltransferase type 11 [Desulfofarcimen acetoxidans DSM 771]|jgi:SAM-dependent methyltransferase|uniref:Methyltransferase type 11 n=1 Tax=Desulfofarcimen acetoxidans (strain ATCC 49208 / DSM 771 / KCTC 5769 / VKM B-1644 / 5575) TaxID=485916 RepID=C8W1Y4_DESAS|nr:class I SAM-dependent methyltransferase [Desulfofarcimen acetoxidans]ACV63605.1 Methyltransferase type 11 [Desulfofarcimen acetoxidans DSM 771]
MKDIFDSYVENIFCSYEQASLKFIQFEKNYKRFFPSNKGAKLLDIGVGRGEMLSCMRNWGYENYIGVDISPSTIRFCKSLDLNCILVDDSTAWLNENKNEFDLITLLDVLEHIKKEHTIEFLKAIKASLKNNGTLIIQVPNLQAPDGQLHRYNDFTHEVGFIEHSLQQVLITAGFKNINFDGFEEFVCGDWREKVKKILRSLFWRYIRFTRLINKNINPRILNPVFYALVKNDVY